MQNQQELSRLEHKSGLYFFLITLYFFSGVCALAYEILWVKAISLLFGISILGVTITVSAFMLGLGFGSLIGYKFRAAMKNPLMLLGVLELFVAIFSFFLPKWMPLIEQLFFSVGEGVTSWLFLQVFFSLLLLFVPAALLGLGFSAFLFFLKERNASLGTVYGFNTLGGVFGVFVPLALLPVFGWAVSLRLVAILGVLVGILFLILAIKQNTKLVLKPSEKIHKNIRMHLMAYFFIGFASLILQIAWTRFYGMVFLRTEYVLAIIVASFLVGIALGSILSKYINPGITKFLLPPILFLSILTSLWLLPWASSFYAQEVFSDSFSAMFEQFVLLIILTLPSTLIFGMWYPILAKDLKLALDSSVVLYGVNSLGAGLGVLVCSFILFPIIGVAATIGFAAGLILLASNAWIKDRRYMFVSVFLFPVSILIAGSPDVKDLMPKFYEDVSDLYIHEDAITTTHVVARQSGERLLLNDLQRMDASSEYSAVQAQRNQSRLPFLLHPNPKDFLFLGLGTGVTVSGIINYPDLNISAVELSTGAIEAASKFFNKVNEDAPSRINVIHDDARRYLVSTDAKFDVVVGDLFHPDLIGRANLLSLQQFSRVKSVMKQNGVFIQWIALNQFDRFGLDVVLRTFKKEFPNNALFLDGFRVALVGYTGEPETYAVLKARMTGLNKSAMEEVLNGEQALTWFARYLGPIEVNDGEVQDDWVPILEFTLPDLKYRVNSPLPGVISRVFSSRPDVRVAMGKLGIPKELMSEFERRYSATEIFANSMIAGMAGDAEKEYKLLSLAYQANPNDRWISSRVADQLFANPPPDIDQETFLNKVVEIRWDHVAALKALAGLYKRRGDQEKYLALSNKVAALQPY